MTQANEERAACAIDEAAVTQFEQDGAICVRAVIGADWIDRLRKATDRVVAARGQNLNLKGSSGNYVGDLDMWLRDTDFRDFALEGPSWRIAKTLMRSASVRLFADQLFVKEPGTTTPTPWHHDQTYWPVLGDQVCSVWVALDAVTADSSGLEYVRGSHRWGRRFKPQAFGERDMGALDEPGNEVMPDFGANRDRYEFLSWDMEPGDVLVHHSLAVHGAGGNRSRTATRRAVATRWLGEDVRFRPLSLFTEELAGLKAGELVSNSKSLFPPVPLPPGRVLPRDYWPS